MSVRYLSKAGPGGNGINGPRVFILLIFLISVMSSPTFGQQMGQLTAYTDSWADDDGTIYSSGVTADSSNSYGHTYGTRTTLTSPAGRTSSAGFNSDNSYNAYAYAETSLPWDWNDLGDYSEQSQHSYYCPISGRTISFNTSTSRKVGVSQAGYYLTSFSYYWCNYDINPNCHVRCGPPNISVINYTSCPGWQARYQGWVEVPGVYTFCIPSHGNMLVPSFNGAVECIDY